MMFEPVDFGLARKVSTGRVEASTGQLWSVGGQGDALYSTDGVAWTALPAPI